jgi:hypothetical protein
MTAKAEFDITANDQGAKAAWDRQQNAINAVIARIGKMEEAQNKAKASQDTFFSKSVAGFAGMVTGALSFQGAMSGVIQANQQMIDQADRAAIKYDELFRKINVQAGVRGLESAGMQKSITDVAIRNASTIEESASTAQQLAGAGFSTADASGGALDAMLKLFGGTGQTGTGNAGQLTQSMTQFISAMGMERNAQNLERIAVAVQQSYKAGDLQLEDLTQIAAKSAGLKGKLSPEETLGAFATIRETMGGEQASTGLKIFGERVTGAREDPMRMEMLKRMKIKADDIDLVGENINQVLETMSKGVAGLPEKERAAVMQKFFGGEGASAASYLIDNRNRIGFYGDRMANRAGFESDAAEAASGPAAQRRRLTLRAETEAARKFQNEKKTLDAADLAASEAGLSPTMRALSRFEANTALALGFSPESAVGFGYSGRFGVKGDGSFGSFGGGLDEDTKRILRETAVASKRTADAVEKAATKPPVVIEKPAVAKKPASAAAGTGGR